MKRIFANISNSFILSGTALLLFQSLAPSTCDSLYAASASAPSDGSVTSEEVKAGRLPLINIASVENLWFSEDSSEWEKNEINREYEVQSPPPIVSPNGKRLARLLPSENDLPQTQISTDGGKNWSVPKPVTKRLQGVGHVPVVLHDGRLAVLFRSPSVFDEKNALSPPLPPNAPIDRNQTEKDPIADNSAPIGEWTLWIGNFHDLENGTPGIYQLLLGPASQTVPSAEMKLLPNGALTARIPFEKETKILKLPQEKLTALDWQMMQKIKFPVPEIVEGGKPTLAPPPEGAVVLFDGSDFTQFSNAADWKLGKDLCPNAEDSDWMEVGRGSITTRQKFGSCRLHLEFATPSEVKGNGQQRGNSGIYFMNRYELQILDSWQNETYPQGQCGAVYTQNPPLKNVCLKPGEWQSYDVTFIAPKFDENGELLSPARFTVYQNGILIQDDFQVIGRNYFIHRYLPHSEKECLLIQDHGVPVRFRNIWIQELD